MKFFRVILSAILFFSALTAWAIPEEDGLYATFDTTKGSFVAQLAFDKVPVTVANFVGLAKGTRAWIDATTGNITHRPFYNGVTFHRVLTNFVIQAGSPNGIGTEGPGYSFGDEFSTALTHDEAGVLSMANSGPNSNGSQFFITLVETPWLDDKHSVFGRIVEGMNVVNEIGSIPTPTPDITTINTITITAIGTNAENFLNNPPAGLPEVLGTHPELTFQNSTLLMRLNRTAISQFQFFRSSNLSAWSYMGTVDDFTTTSQPIDLTKVASGKSREFYKVAKVAYPPQPTSLIGKNIIFSATSSAQTYRFEFTTGEGYATNGNFGTFQIDDDPPGILRGYFIGYDPTQNGHNFRRNYLSSYYLNVSLEDSAYTFSLKFQSTTNGWFTCQPYGATNGFWPIFGTFESPPPAP